MIQQWYYDCLFIDLKTCPVNTGTCAAVTPDATIAVIKYYEKVFSRVQSFDPEIFKYFILKLIYFLVDPGDWIFVTNSDFLIPISLQPYVVLI